MFSKYKHCSRLKTSYDWEDLCNYMNMKDFYNFESETSKDNMHLWLPLLTGRADLLAAPPVEIIVYIVQSAYN